MFPFGAWRLAQAVAATVPKTPLVLCKLKAIRSCSRGGPQTSVAIGSLRLTVRIPQSDRALRHPRTTRWRLHLLTRIASFLSLRISRRLAPLAFRGIRRRPHEAMQPLDIKTMSDRLVAATAHGSTFFRQPYSGRVRGAQVCQVRPGHRLFVICHLSFAAKGASRTLS